MDTNYKEENELIKKQLLRDIEELGKKVKEQQEELKHRRNVENIFHCSFCGKSQQKVRKLIAGPAVYICEECVNLCCDIIREEKNKSEKKEEMGGSIDNNIEQEKTYLVSGHIQRKSGKPENKFGHVIYAKYAIEAVEFTKDKYRREGFLNVAVQFVQRIDNL